MAKPSAPRMMAISKTASRMEHCKPLSCSGLHLCPHDQNQTRHEYAGKGVGLGCRGRAAFSAERWETLMTEARPYPESDPQHHTSKLHDMLTAVVQHALEDIGKIDEPRAQALFEATAEVCAGLATAMEHYQEQNRPGAGHAA